MSSKWSLQRLSNQSHCEWCVHGRTTVCFLFLLVTNYYIGNMRMLLPPGSMWAHCLYRIRHPLVAGSHLHLSIVWRWFESVYTIQLYGMSIYLVFSCVALDWLSYIDSCYFPQRYSSHRHLIHSWIVVVLTTDHSCYEIRWKSYIFGWVLSTCHYGFLSSIYNLTFGPLRIS